MDRLPPELHLRILEISAEASPKELHTLARTNKNFYALYKKHERRLHECSLQEEIRTTLVYPALVLTPIYRQTVALAMAPVELGTSTVSEIDSIMAAVSKADFVPDVDLLKRARERFRIIHDMVNECDSAFPYGKPDLDRDFNLISIFYSIFCTLASLDPPDASVKGFKHIPAPVIRDYESLKAGRISRIFQTLMRRYMIGAITQYLHTSQMPRQLMEEGLVKDIFMEEVNEALTGEGADWTVMWRLATFEFRRVRPQESEEEKRGKRVKSDRLLEEWIRGNLEKLRCRGAIEL